MRAFGADDEKATRTPAAWMISPVPLLQTTHACGVDDGLLHLVRFPVPFLAWVTSDKRHWVILAKYRRIDSHLILMPNSVYTYLHPQIFADLQRQDLRQFRPCRKHPHPQRSGIEGRISVLFRGRGMKRCRAKGRERFTVLVGAGVLANNLLRIARMLQDDKPKRRAKAA